jgi:hypothetical protein
VWQPGKDLRRARYERRPASDLHPTGVLTQRVNEDACRELETRTCRDVPGSASRRCDDRAISKVSRTQADTTTGLPGETNCSDFGHLRSVSRHWKTDCNFSGAPDKEVRNAKGP